MGGGVRIARGGGRGWVQKIGERVHAVHAVRVVSLHWRRLGQEGS